MVYTNAMHNRHQAVRLFEAGFTVKEIAAAFGKVWKLGPKRGLVQRYNRTLADGRKEINRMMSSQHVDDMILNKKLLECK